MASRGRPPPPSSSAPLTTRTYRLAPERHGADVGDRLSPPHTEMFGRSAHLSAASLSFTHSRPLTRRPCRPPSPRGIPSPSLRLLIVAKGTVGKGTPLFLRSGKGANPRTDQNYVHATANPPSQPSRGLSPPWRFPRSLPRPTEIFWSNLMALREPSWRTARGTNLKVYGNQPYHDITGGPGFPGR
jgi:hypothetical protein